MRRRPPRTLQSLRSLALLSSALLSQRSRCSNGSPAQNSQMARVGKHLQTIPLHSLTDKQNRPRHKRVHRSARNASASICCTRLQTCHLWNSPANAAKPASPFDQRARTTQASDKSDETTVTTSQKCGRRSRSQEARRCARAYGFPYQGNPYDAWHGCCAT